MHAEEGGYWAEVPALPGCYSQGETIEATMNNNDVATAAESFLNERCTGLRCGTRSISEWIATETVVAKLSGLLEKLQERRGMRIFKRGLAKAAVLLNGVENGISGWVLPLKEWLKAHD